MKGVFPTILLVLILWTCSSTASDQVISRPRPAAVVQTNGWFADYDATSFRRVAEARRAIHPQRLDRDLLDAAVLHETNRRRLQHNLPPLRFDARARTAARIQASAMAKGEFVDHENPEPRYRTMADRAKVAGLRPRMLAENVASAFGRRYESGKQFYTRQENGRTVYSYEPDGPPIAMHSHISFAEALVEGWMKSPGHRKNILAPSARFLGCACEPGGTQSQMETFKWRRSIACRCFSRRCPNRAIGVERKGAIESLPLASGAVHC